MKQYSVQVSGMTCNGCRMLTTEALKDQGFDEVDVNLLKNEALFRSNRSESEVLSGFDAISKEYPKFSFSLLKEI